MKRASILFASLLIAVSLTAQTLIKDIQLSGTGNQVKPGGKLTIPAGATLDVSGATLLGFSSGALTLYGIENPTSGLGKDGDTYFNKATGGIWTRAAGSWTLQLTVAFAVHTHAKADFGLGLVDNTSDASKPISNATQTALDGKASLTGQNLLTFRPGVRWNDLGSISGNQTLVWGTNYRAILTDDITITSFTGVLVNGGSASLDITTDGTNVVNYPSAYRWGSGLSPGTSLTPPAGRHIITWLAMDDGSIRVADSVPPVFNDGKTIFGSGVPSDLTGNNGDVYQRANGEIYAKASNAWGSPQLTLALGTHQHPASQISDATTAGRALLTAANSAAQLSLLGISGTNTGDQNLFGSILVTGQTTVTATTPAQGLTLEAGANVTITTDNSTKKVIIAAGGGPGGSGTVTGFSAGALSPLFTTGVATSTTTPALTFTLTNAAQNAVLAGPATGGTGAPSYRALVAADIPSLTLAKISNAGTVAGLNVAASGNAASGEAVKGDDTRLTDRRRVLNLRTQLTYASSITPNCDTTTAIEVSALTGDIVINAPTGTPQPYQTMLFLLTQDATGGHNITWDSAYHWGTVMPQTPTLATTTGYKALVGAMWIPSLSQWWITSCIGGF